MVEEALGCFLEQDYDGDMELVIVNDDVDQELVFDHPQVRIINMERRVRNLGVKRNIAVSECRGDYLMCIDDDDLFGPDRISRAMANMQDECWASDRFFMDLNPPVIAVGAMHWNFIFSKRLFIRYGAYCTVEAFGSCEVRMRGAIIAHMKRHGIGFDQGAPNFLYRRFTKAVAHHTDRAGYRRFEAATEKKRVGRIELRPKYYAGLFDRLAELNAKTVPLKDVDKLEYKQSA